MNNFYLVCAGADDRYDVGTLNLEPFLKNHQISNSSQQVFSSIIIYSYSFIQRVYRTERERNHQEMEENIYIYIEFLLLVCCGFKRAESYRAQRFQALSYLLPRCCSLSFTLLISICTVSNFSHFSKHLCIYICSHYVCVYVYYIYIPKEGHRIYYAESFLNHMISSFPLRFRTRDFMSFYIFCLPNVSIFAILIQWSVLVT